MKNQTILNKRWTFTNLKLKEYVKLYKKINLDSQDEIQYIFKDVEFSFKDFNKTITTNQRNKFIRLVEKWKKEGLLKGYFGYVIVSTIRKNIITNKELLQLLLWSVFLKERKKLEIHEKKLFTSICENFYNQGREELKTKKKSKWSITWNYIYSLLCIPYVKGSSWNNYIEAISLTNAQELQQQVMINLQQGKKLDIENTVFQNIIKKQKNRYICINGNKYSGALDSQISVIANKSYLKVAEDIKNKNQQVRFIAEMDDRTTKMCKGMLKVND